jgi:hypothetical protein
VDAPMETGVTKSSAANLPVESEITETNMIGYGSRKIFGAAERCNLWAAGVEYDRHIWGYFLKSRMDYVAEFLPFVLLSQPTSTDIWGNALSNAQETVHGVGVTPVGARMLWRSDKAIRPYLVGKLGIVAFPKNVPSTQASAVNFALQGDFGVAIRLSQRMDLRVDPLEFFHFSNADLAKSNPGVDVLAVKFGISYQLGRPSR